MDRPKDTKTVQEGTRAEKIAGRPQHQVCRISHYVDFELVQGTLYSWL